MLKFDVFFIFAHTTFHMIQTHLVYVTNNNGAVCGTVSNISTNIKQQTPKR